jgi:2'-5' RNA ligase
MNASQAGEAARPERLHRLFFALWPSDEFRAALEPRILALQPEGVGRPQRPDQWHLTLEFLGPVPESRVALARDAAAGVQARPCQVLLDAVEYWRRPGVLCLVAKVVPEALCELVAQLRNGLAARGFQPESRPFRAHMTLARKVVHPVSPVAFEPLHWPVADFTLVESVTDRSGSVYTPLARWPLRA